MTDDKISTFKSLRDTIAKDTKEGIELSLKDLQKFQEDEVLEGLVAISFLKNQEAPDVVIAGDASIYKILSILELIKYEILTMAKEDSLQY